MGTDERQRAGPRRTSERSSPVAVVGARHLKPVRIVSVNQRPDSRATRSAYDSVAADYARLLPDLGAETSLDRAMLAAFADLVANARLGPVADLGCGTGRITAHLHSMGVDIFGIDLSQGMVDVARRTHPSLRFVVGSITAVGLADGVLGGVLAWYSTIHTSPKELPGVFDELYRVLAPGGYLLVGFHVGDEDQPRTVTAYRDGFSVLAYDATPERVAELAVEAGLAVHAQLVREPQAGEKRRQASLIATRPSVL